FEASTYPAINFNFDPAVVCLPHTDAANDPGNLCHITALGQFNLKKGVHIILYDLKLIIE
ncbi:hypothetical protein C8Q78DRAFT_950893, partial [Trametes maxima]